MRILIVFSSKNGSVAPFVQEQIESLSKYQLKIELFLINRGGILGYFINYFRLLKKIIQFKPDIIHAHYGLAGFLCCLLPFRPVITTFHGSDVMNYKIRPISKLASFLSSESIFVSRSLQEQLKTSKGYVIPCGINLKLFKPNEQRESRKKMNIPLDEPLILFGSNKNRKEKNYELAENSFEFFKRKFPYAMMFCLKGYSREEVALLLNAADVAFLTSKWEGSPQFIKEALATSTPIVSTDVGDIKERTKNVASSYIFDEKTTSHAQIANYIENAFSFRRKHKWTNGREILIAQDVSIEKIGEEIFTIYKKNCKNNI